MNKTIKLSVVALIIMMIISSCVTKNIAYKNNGEINFNAHYIRTNPIVPAVEYPSVIVISSKAELEQYYLERYDVSAYPYLDQSSELKDAIAGYVESYFQDKILVIVVLEESSGGIRHKVEKIENDGSIVISRLVPEMGTADMAEWNIIIELDNNSRLNEYNVELIN
jgi:hypothetical protein